MAIVFDIMKVSQLENQNIDYETLVFMVDMDKRISIDNSREYWIFFKTLIDGGALKFLINFKNNEFIDSSGIGILIKVAKLLKMKKGKVVICGISNELMDVFKVINLQKLIDIVNSEVEAVNSFRYL